MAQSPTDDLLNGIETDQYFGEEIDFPEWMVRKQGALALKSDDSG
jgi:hypothetical protein